MLASAFLSTTPSTPLPLPSINSILYYTCVAGYLRGKGGPAEAPFYPTPYVPPPKISLVSLSFYKTHHEVHILHIKVDLTPRFSQHPSVPAWHTLTPTLNFPAQGQRCPFPESLLPIQSRYFDSSFSLHVPRLPSLPSHGNFPYLLPWDQWTCPPESSFLMNPHLM